MHYNAAYLPVFPNPLLIPAVPPPQKEANQSKQASKQKQNQTNKQKKQK